MNELETLTTNTSTATFRSNGKGWFGASGTWGGGSITPEFSPDNGTTWLALLDMDPATVDFIRMYELPTDGLIRLTLADSAGASLKIWN